MRLWIAVKASEFTVQEWEAVDGSTPGSIGCRYQITAGYKDSENVATTLRRAEALGHAWGEAFAVGLFEFGRAEVVGWIDNDGTPVTVALAWYGTYGEK